MCRGRRLPGVLVMSTNCVKETLPKRCRPGGLGVDLTAAGLLVFLALALFRSHVLGQSIYIGNPDRLNSHLKILKFHVDGIEKGQIAAWNPFEMMGFDTFVMPYTFPNLLTFVTAWIGKEHLYQTAGWISLILLAGAGVAVYGFVRLYCQPLPSLIAAILYQFSALTLLKVSQNDMSFAVFIWVPLLALGVVRCTRWHPAWGYLYFTVLLFLLLQFMFLQTAAYALLFTATFALYRSLSCRRLFPIMLLAVAGISALIPSWPRIYSIASAMGQYERVIENSDLKNFDVLYQNQNIRPIHILRWFDDTIFGRCPSDSVKIGSCINLTEGFLLYTSTLVPILVLTGAIWYRRRFAMWLYSAEKDCCFFWWFFVLTVLAALVKPVQYVLFLLFLKMDFTHARILLVALLPMVTLVALVLEDRLPAGWSELTITSRVGCLVVGIALAAGLYVGAEAVADLGGDSVTLIQRQPPLFLRDASVLRIVFLVLFALLFAALVFLVPNRPVKCTAYAAICFFLVWQTLADAEFRINGEHVQKAQRPFYLGDQYAAPAGGLRLPSEDQVQQLHHLLQNDRFRCVLLGDPAVAGGFVDGHVPAFWRLRAIGGYYGIGVPKRLRLLPWGNAISLRTISFSERHSLPWRLLALVNVKFAIDVPRDLYLNGNDDRPLATLRYWQNPFPVVPRVFFARAIVPADSPRDAARKLLERQAPFDVREASIVEGIGAPARFLADGEPVLHDFGDRLLISLAPAKEKRFLVINELHYPGWEASAAGQPLTVYPVNCVMRGVEVPPGADSIEFRYRPVIRRPWAWASYGAGLALAVGLFCFLRHKPKSRRIKHRQPGFKPDPPAGVPLTQPAEAGTASG
ncbi:MAG: hypothetical protein KatS3mg105_2355 [Gemmatales bacterium]|nr:MAG: hypothetical protein KatS3mg105_2355 [Gemmatales bacterium]